MADHVKLCSPRNINAVQAVIDQTINEDVKYSKSPLDLLNQRTFAVKGRLGLSSALDPANLAQSVWSERIARRLSSDFQRELRRCSRIRHEAVRYAAYTSSSCNIRSRPLAEESSLKLELKYDPQRRFYLRIKVEDLPDRRMPADFIDVVKKKDKIECTTMVLKKRNHKVRCACHRLNAAADMTRSRSRMANVYR